MHAGGLATRNEVLVLAAACAGAGLVTLGTVVMPFSDTAPTGLGVVLGVFGLLLGGLLVIVSRRTHVAVLHTVLVVASTAITTCVAASTTAAGPAVTACSYFWLALYAAFFLSRDAVAAHVALIATGLGIGMSLSSAPSPVQSWWFITVTLTAVAATVHVSVERLRRLAYRDPLTGLVTRTAFRAMAEQAMTLSARTGQPLSLAIIDLDDFKAVNDTHGHARGDALLVSLARSWEVVLRGADVLGRHGGDEFVLLMPATPTSDSTSVLQRMRDSVPDTGWSAGVAEWTGEPLDAWLKRADSELYMRKQERQDLRRRNVA